MSKSITFPFDQGRRRERISLGREYDWTIAVIPAGSARSEEIDVTMAAGIAVSVDNSMSGTHLAIYATHESGGTMRPVRDKDNSLLIVTATDGAIIVLPPEVFPLGYISLVSCSDADGTEEEEQSELNLVVMVKG
ncbi:MAG: hypothetical protein GF347_00590 [Candidatus Moranbacteria bacterium]|nr:hypothetical protein [Candidatus Moranbacteria bacterium]